MHCFQCIVFYIPNLRVWYQPQKKLQMASWILWAVGIAFAFTVWPILGKVSGASGAWVGTLVVAGTLITTLIFGAKDMVQGPLFTLKALVILALAGLVNGAAVYYYSVKAVDPGVPTGIFVATMVVLMALMAPLIDWMVNGNTINAKQIAGLGAAVVAIYLLKG